MSRPLFLSASLFAIATALSPMLSAEEHAGHAHAGHAHAAEHEEPAGHAAPVPAAPRAHAEHADHGDHEEHAEGAAEEHHEQVVIATANLATFGIAVEAVSPHVVSEPVIAPGWATYDPHGEFQVGVSTPGRVVRMLVSVGTTVAAGDLLAEILCPGFVEAQNQWLVKRAAVGTAALAMDQAQAAVERGRQTGDGISKAEQQRREFELKHAQQGKLAAETDLAAAKNTVLLMAGDAFDFTSLAEKSTALQTLSLLAPAAGVVIDIGAVRGQQVAPEGAPVVTVADPTRLWVVVQIPESLLTQVQVGSSVEVTGFSGARLATGTISHLTPEIDPHTRTGRARVLVADSAALRPGMYVHAAIVPGTAMTNAPVLAVPESALQTFEGKTVVFVEERTDKQATFRPRPVSIGPVQGGHAPILSGLKEGESVVVQGSFLLAADLGKEGAEHVH